MNFRDRLGAVLEDQYALDTPVPSNAITAVQELQRQLEDAQRNVADLEIRYNNALSEYQKQMAGELTQQNISRPCGRSQPLTVDNSGGTSDPIIVALTQILGGL